MKRLSCDVLVAGGGVAGCCAAIAAARCGVRTILVERQGHLGGTGYDGLLQHICGLYLNGDTFPHETLNAGLTDQIVGLLEQYAPEKKVKKIGQVYVLPYAVHNLTDVLESLCAAETDLTVLRDTFVSGVTMSGANVGSATVESPDETVAITAVMVIDCTGNGDVAAMSGAEFELSPENDRQLAGYSIRVSGVDDSAEMLSIKVPYFCAEAVNQCLLPPLMKFTTFTAGDAPGEGFIKMSLDGEDTPDRDRHALENAQALLESLKQALPAFRDARITGASLKVLEREGRRIVGDYMLTEEDVLTARKFPDAIVRNAWPIEMWDRSRGTLYTYVPRGDWYEIPFRCITVKGITNLLTAGRCISVSHAALGSTRVMGTCMALGEQAGRAAALRVRNGEYSNAPERLL
jgi:hypothetical protein